MSQITYIQGNAAYPQAEGNKIIAHCCNNLGLWGKGFVLSLSNRWPIAREKYVLWKQTSPAQLPFKLAQTMMLRVEPDIYIANIIGQEGIYAKDGQPPIRYGALLTGLQKVAQQALGLKATVHMPRIGCGLAGGKWATVQPMIQKELVEKGIDVYVYIKGNN